MDSRFIWKPQEFLQALKDKGSYQNPALSIPSYPQDQQKGRWLPISLSPETDCDCGVLILPTPPSQILCILTDSSNIVACHYKGGIWGGTIQLSITLSYSPHVFTFFFSCLYLTHVQLSFQLLPTLLISAACPF